MKQDKMLYKLKKALDSQRYEHTLGVADTARLMARCFHEDEEKAALAGLLHDCAKCLPLDKMIKAAKGEKPDAVMRESKALMHALAGMCMARELYGVEDEAVLSAIRWHTTGRPAMSLLEKIIYMADYIEPCRNFEGVEPLRKLAYENLDKAMALGLEMSIADIRSYGNPVHEMSAAALAYYKKKATE